MVKESTFHIDESKKGVVYDIDGNVKSCIFCKIVNGEEFARKVYDEEPEHTVFRTLSPAPTKGEHFLVVPRTHIQNVKSLSGPSGAEYIRRMVAVGKLALGKVGAETKESEDTQFSFHIPPWNSIDHLHLHVISNRKTMNYLGYLKYYEGSYWCRSATSLIKELEQTADRPPTVTVEDTVDKEVTSARSSTANNKRYSSKL